MHFSRVFQKYSFGSVALVTKKLWAILDFFLQTGLFYPYSTLTKNPLNYNSLKVKKFHGMVKGRSHIIVCWLKVLVNVMSHDLACIVSNVRVPTVKLKPLSILCIYIEIYI